MKHRRLLYAVAFPAAIALHVPAIRLFLTRREIGLLSLQRTQDCLFFAAVSLALLVVVWAVRPRKITIPAILLQAMMIGFAGGRLAPGSVLHRQSIRERMGGRDPRRKR